MSFPPMFRICPFLIIAIASMPVRVRRAVQKPPKPSPGRINRLIRRWSCSTMLFKYLTRRSRERRHNSAFCFISVTGIVRLTGSGPPVGGRRDCGMTSPPDPHYRHRFPAEIIIHAVWLYHVFSLSLRDVELLLAERGIVVSALLQSFGADLGSVS